MTEASVSIRLNPFKPCSVLPYEGDAVPWNRHAVTLKQRPLFTLDPLFHAGCYYVQDASAMYVGYVFRKVIDSMSFGKDGPKVLDLCAAPGGKTTDVASSLRECFGDGFTLVSNEVMKSRIGVLTDNIAVWGDQRVAVCSADPKAFAEAEGCFDVILADVPCSGEGMFRKDPRAEKELSPDVVALCASRQKRIIADVWPALRDGGALVYSTCTYEKAENDDNLLWIAETLGGEIIPAGNEFSSFGVENTEYGNILRAGVVSCGEGQWVGVVRKKSSEKGRCNLSSLEEKLHLQWLGEREADAPLNIKFDKEKHQCVEVDRHTALSFLHRDVLFLPEAALGYNVITYLGHPLGYVKNIGKRCNNLLPKSRRILMNI